MAVSGYSKGMSLVTDCQSDRSAQFLRRFDYLVFAGVLALAALPFGQVYSFNIGPARVNTYELICILLIVALAFRGLFLGRGPRLMPVALLVAVVGFHLVDTLLFREPRMDYLIVQLRYFLPFPVAALLLWTGTTISFRQVLYGLSLAALVGAASALLVHYFFTDFLTVAFAQNDYYTRLSRSGRLFWPNASLAFFPIIMIIDSVLRNKRVPLMVIVSCLVTLFALFNYLNRTFFVAFFIFILACFWKSRAHKRYHRLLTVAVAFAVVASVVIIAAMALNPTLSETTAERVLGSGSGLDPGKLYSNDLLNGRVPLYRQYFGVSIGELLYGRGLGVPFARTIDYTQGTESEYITTDVSVLAFLLPYGVAGVVVFVAFLIYLLRAIPRLSPGQRVSVGWMAKALLFCGLLISLNVDVFYTDNFVIFLTFLVMAARVVPELCDDGGAAATVSRPPLSNVAEMGVGIAKL